MQKTKFLKFSIISLGLFLVASFGIVYAFEFKTTCQSPLNTFSNGNSTFDISFPPGGGTTCDTITDCPKIKLPDGATIFSMKVDMELTDPDSEIGTPYIWVPITNNNQLAQIRTSDCSIVKTFKNNADNCGNNAFSSPSRITVIPGGDVWIDNRTNTKVTRLGLIDPGVNMEDYECKDSYNIPGGGGTNGGGVTFDKNGDIWVGNYHDTFVHKFKPDGLYAWSAPNKINANHATYGMIGDPYGHVWIANRGTGGETLQCIKVDKDNNETSFSTAYTYSTGSVYGIGMDGVGRVYLANHDNGDVYRFPAVISGNCPGATLSPDRILSTGGGKARGVAVDQKGNVWVANSTNNHLYVFDAGNNYSKHSVLLAGSGIVGVAIDSDGYGWAVGRINGKVYKYKYDSDSFTKECIISLGGGPYNYSDMTGLRTVPKTLTVGFSGVTIPLSETGSFEICSDPTAPPLCSDSSNCDDLLLPTTCSDASGFCEIPLKIFSMQIGDYTLKNLEVVYGKQVPFTTGGLVPCGREWNDSLTSWDDREPCSLCYLIPLTDNIIKFLIKIVSVLAILFIIIGGILYTSAGSNSNSITMAKSAITKSVFGFTIVLIAWVMINVIMILFGFSDPLGDGSWKIFNRTT